MYQDDPEVKCELIRSATSIVLATQEGASMNQETADKANEYLQAMFDTIDDTEEEDPE